MADRASKPTLTIYIQAEESLGFEKTYCIFCGLPFGATTGRVTMVTDAPSFALDVVVGDQNQCRRCRQKYRRVFTFDR